MCVLVLGSGGAAFKTDEYVKMHKKRKATIKPKGSIAALLERVLRNLKGRLNESDCDKPKGDKEKTFSRIKHAIQANSIYNLMSNKMLELNHDEVPNLCHHHHRARNSQGSTRPKSCSKL